MTQNTQRFDPRLVIITGAVVVISLLILAGVFFLYRSLAHHPVGTPQPIPIINNTSNGSSGTTALISANAQGISIRLSEGKAQVQFASLLPTAAGEPLSQNETNQLLGRLPTLAPASSDQVAFKLSNEPLPPPRPGQTIQQPFPPAEQPTPAAPAEAGPLEVLRYAPQGEIPIAPFVSITFNQPMVALTTLDQLAAKDVPVMIDPALPGTWRWLGTKTLTFEYDSTLIDRLPKATDYTVTIPAGAQFASGGILAQAVTWTFSTPPVKLTSSYPAGEGMPRNPIIFIGFDQRIDPAAVLKKLQVNAGSAPVSVKLASPAEVSADQQVSSLAKSAGDGRWLALRAEQLLPADSAITVTVGAGTPSAEGPRLTPAAQSFSFHTYAALKIVEHNCSTGSNNECQPLTPLYINFNNALDEAAYQDSLLTIQPALPGVSVSIMGSTVLIQGATQGQTTYTVTVSKDIQDVYGQKLGEDTTVTFKVGSAYPLLTGPNQPFVTLDPASTQPVFTVYTINYTKLVVQVYAVQPANWPDFKQYMQDFQRGQSATPPGNKVMDKTIAVEAATDTLAAVDIDLKPLMDGSFGQFIVVVSPPKSLFKPNESVPTVQAWVQVTQIGVDAFTDHSEMVIWTNALKDGKPLVGVSISPGPLAGQQATSGADGTVRIPIPDGATYLVAKQGADQAILPRNFYPWDNNGWATWQVQDELRWYVYDDRQMYRPGEDVHIKGWLRQIGRGQNGDVGLVGSALSGVSYQVTDSQGNAIGSGQAQANSLGGFDFAFSIPQQVNLGYTQVNLQAQGDLSGLQGIESWHTFQIQEFRRPEFEVTARTETNGPYFAGGQAVLAVAANYYAGGPLPNADVTWSVTSTPSSYAPPNWPDFTFGTWTPWWEVYSPGAYSRATPYFPPGVNAGGKVETFTGKTDATGTHYLNLDISNGDLAQPVSITAEADVMDVNRQTWASTTTFLVHPADLYVGLRSASYFVERGAPLKVDFIVTDLDGTVPVVVDRPVEITAARLDWKYVQGNWTEVEADTQTCKQGSAAQPATCTFQTPVGGTYRITATVIDDQGRKNQSQLTRWVSGGQQPPSRKVEQETATLIPDKESYQPGDVAKILVQSPFSPAEGLLIVDRSGILSTTRFHMDSDSLTLSIPIEEKNIPNLNVEVDLTGAAPRLDDNGQALSNVPERPAYAVGQIDLKIPPLQRTLTVEAVPAQKALAPGASTTLEVQVMDAHGKPVANAELSVVVVDEAILALTQYQVTDPLSIFYIERGQEVSGQYSRASLVLADPTALGTRSLQGVAQTQVVESFGAMPSATSVASMAGAPAMPKALAARDALANAATTPIQVRSDFNPLAVFAPSVYTDGEGRASVPVKLPDNLTRYRVIVVAVDDSGKQFGKGESTLTARLPLMVRLSAPRFLNFGDKFELPVVLQNQTDAPLVVNVAVQASNLTLTGSSGLRVTVPGNDRVEVRFPAQTDKAGAVHIQVAAASGDFADAATVDVPVYTPATTEAFATYGVLDNGAAMQPVAAPTGVFPQYGGLEINTSSTALQTLTDAVLYLVSYPYDGSEERASRILAITASRDVLTAFKAEGLPAPADLDAAVQNDMTALQGLQNDDGGFPYWARGKDSIPFNTLHVAHALATAKLKDYSVPQDMQNRLVDYLRNIESHYPNYYSARTRSTLSAYALYVRNLMSDPDPGKALKLIDSAGLDNLDLDAVGWLWQVIESDASAAGQIEAIRKLVNNRVVETAGAANFTTSYDDQTYLLLSSDRRTDAILLNALINDNPQSDLIPKLVNGLLAHRTAGRWGNTQENVFVLLAMDRYFNTFEAQTPDFIAKIWLGEGYAGSATYQGHTTERNETLIPMTALLDQTQKDGGQSNLLIDKTGAGRLYYRLGLSYAPTNLDLQPLDMGFTVQRAYEAVDDPADVTRDANGIWHIKAGARVRVHLTMVTDNRRYHVALVDHLPAGLEIVNPALAVSGSVPQDPNSLDYKYGWWWWGTWYEHQNLHDDRAEAFASLLWDGVYQYTYIARATTPGTFVTPPAKAEEMYSPEVFGRGSSDIVIVQ